MVSYAHSHCLSVRNHSSSSWTCTSHNVSHQLNFVWLILYLSRDLGTTQPVHHANAVENELNNVAAPSATCSTIDRMKEQPKNGEDSFLDSNKCLELIDNSILVGMDLGFKSSSDDKIAIIQSNFDLKSNFCKKQEVDFFNLLSCFHLILLVKMDMINLWREYISGSICRIWIGSFQQHPP